MSRTARRLLALVFLLMLAATGVEFTRPAKVPPDQAQERTPAPDMYADVPVLRVIDGDTLLVRLPEGETRVRLIGVDTPESVDPRRPVECFGKEATRFTRSFLASSTVRLVTDPTQDRIDRYGRLLAYVYTPDGRLLNEQLIIAGYAHEYTYRIPYQKQALFRAAATEAKRAARGLYAPDACKETPAP